MKDLYFHSAIRRRAEQELNEWALLTYGSYKLFLNMQASYASMSTPIKLNEVFVIPKWYTVGFVYLFLTLLHKMKITYFSWRIMS